MVLQYFSNSLRWFRGLSCLAPLNCRLSIKVIIVGLISNSFVGVVGDAMPISNLYALGISSSFKATLVFSPMLGCFSCCSSSLGGLEHKERQENSYLSNCPLYFRIKWHKRTSTCSVYTISKETIRSTTTNLATKGKIFLCFFQIRWNKLNHYSKKLRHSLITASFDRGTLTLSLMLKILSKKL